MSLMNDPAARGKAAYMQSFKQGLVWLLKTDAAQAERLAEVAYVSELAYSAFLRGEGVVEALQTPFRNVHMTLLALLKELGMRLDGVEFDKLESDLRDLQDQAALALRSELTRERRPHPMNLL